MKVCSWDVGIKNLAYCILEKVNDTKFNIIKWDVINIIEDDQHVCTAQMKNGNSCTHVAIYSGLNLDNTTSYYCGQHKGSYKPLEDDWELTYMNQVNNNQCNYLSTKNIECGKIAKQCKDDKYYCASHSKIILNHHRKLYALTKIKKKKCSSYDPQVLAHNMYSKLNEIKHYLLDVDNVLIENQPSLKNPTMKTISSLLLGYFVYNGQVVIMSNSKKIGNVRFINPSNKLKVNDLEINDILNKINADSKPYKIVLKLTQQYLNIDEMLIDKYFNHQDDVIKYIKLVLRYLMDKKNTLLKIKEDKLDKIIKLEKDTYIKLIEKIEKDNKNYDITKSLAILYARVIITNNYTDKIIINNWLDHLNKYKKQDDMCDSLLQGYYCLFIGK